VSDERVRIILDVKVSADLEEQLSAAALAAQYLAEDLGVQVDQTLVTRPGGEVHRVGGQ
jgi:hypothetical protein